MKATITFDDQGGITIEGDDEAVKRAYEIWDPYKTGKYAALAPHGERGEFVLVPREPSEEMLTAGEGAGESSITPTYREKALDIYKAMIQAHEGEKG